MHQCGGGVVVKQTSDVVWLLQLEEAFGTEWGVTCLSSNKVGVSRTPSTWTTLDVVMWFPPTVRGGPPVRHQGSSTDSAWHQSISTPFSPGWIWGNSWPSSAQLLWCSSPYWLVAAADCTSSGRQWMYNWLSSANTSFVFTHCGGSCETYRTTIHIWMFEAAVASLIAVLRFLRSDFSPNFVLHFHGSHSSSFWHSRNIGSPFSNPPFSAHPLKVW